MTTSTIASFIDNLRDSRLLQAGQIDELLRTPDAQEVDAATLGQCLVQLGWLTPFQLDEVAQGRGAGLTLPPYRLLEKLGSGPLGASYKAQHLERDGTFMLRLIAPERLMSGLAQDRFLKVTMAASGLSHPALAKVLGVEAAGDHVVYVREYVDGTDLAKLVQDQGALPVAQASDAVQQVAAALQAIHDLGLTHGRIQPRNVFAVSGASLLPGGNAPQAVKLVDLGLGALDEPAPAPVGRDLADLGKLFAYLLSGGGEALPAEVPDGVRDVQRRLQARLADGGFGSASEVAAALAPFGTPTPPALVEPPAPVAAEPAPPVLAEPEPPPPVPEPIPAAAPALDITEPPPPPAPVLPPMAMAPSTAGQFVMPAKYAASSTPAAPAFSGPTVFTNEPAPLAGAFAEAPSRVEDREELPPPRKKKKYGARFWILALLGLVLHIIAFGILVVAVMNMMEQPSTYKGPGTGPRVFPKAK